MVSKDEVLRFISTVNLNVQLFSISNLLSSLLSLIGSYLPWQREERNILYAVILKYEGQRSEKWLCSVFVPRPLPPKLPCIFLTDLFIFSPPDQKSVAFTLVVCMKKHKTPPSMLWKTYTFKSNQSSFTCLYYAATCWQVQWHFSHMEPSAPAACCAEVMTCGLWRSQRWV